ncbi:MAG: alpha-L-fucosidase, partial [Reyranella sp.]|nr:alpha-L-fucosidase [Reyranella sp.]
SKGGNVLLNIGPKPDGSIQPEFVTRLEAMG